MFLVVAQRFRQTPWIMPPGCQHPEGMCGFIISSKGRWSQ